MMNTVVCFYVLYVLQMDAQWGIGKQTNVMQDAPGRSAVNRQKVEKKKLNKTTLTSL